MGWQLFASSRGEYIWRCDFYSDLQYSTINNFAEFGQPHNRLEQGFDKNLDASLDINREIIIEMSQREVMENGYGRKINPELFPAIRRFLSGSVKVPDGTHTFKDLLSKNIFVKGDNIVKTDLYTGALIDSGTISRGDAAYIHGTVAFALMSDTKFTVNGRNRTVSAEFGARHDNWDFE